MASTGSNSSAPPDPLAPADYVVAVPAFNQAPTIQPVLAAAGVVLQTRFPGLRGRIMVADSGSTDETATVARAAAPSGVDLQVLTLPAGASGSVPYHGLPGRARALRAIFEAAHESGAGAVAVLDGTAPGMSADWIERLLRPALADRFDFVAPSYRRHAFDGALVKGIIQPVYRACYGLRLHQPTGPDFACSRRMVDHVLQPRVWTPDVSDAGVDLWLAATAAAGQLAVCEAVVGVRVRAGGRDETADFAETVAQVVGALFTELDRRAAVWQRVRGSVAVPAFDDVAEPAPETPPIDPARLANGFRLGYRELADVWAEILPPHVILELRRLAATPDAAFRMEDRTWARIVYDFALGHRIRVIARDHLLRALAPIYLGWVASLMLEWRAAGEPVGGIDARIERLCDSFEAEKQYLISRWRWPERFRPR